MTKHIVWGVLILPWAARACPGPSGVIYVVTPQVDTLMR